MAKEIFLTCVLLLGFIILMIKVFDDYITKEWQYAFAGVALTLLTVVGLASALTWIWD